MARKRMLEVSIAYDEHLNAVSEFAELIYFRILPHTDDFGRFNASPKIIKARTLPMRESRTVADVADAILELVEIGLFRVYEGQGKFVLQLNEEAFNRINAVLIKNNKSGSEYPEVERFLTLEEYRLHVQATCEARTIESKKYKVKSKEQEVESKEIEAKFNLFYSKYPRKTGKKEALRSFIKLNPDDELLDKILISVDSQIAVDMLNNGQYTPHPATWLNQERWNDQIINKGIGNESHKQTINRGKGAIDFNKYEQLRNLNPDT